jgi:hypothetical protein
MTHDESHAGMICLPCKHFVSYKELYSLEARNGFRPTRRERGRQKPTGQPELVLVDPIDGEPVPKELSGIVEGEWKAKP